MSEQKSLSVAEISSEAKWRIATTKWRIATLISSEAKWRIATLILKACT